MLNLCLVAISEEKHTLSSNLIFEIVTLLSFSLIIKVLINLVPLVLRQRASKKGTNPEDLHTNWVAMVVELTGKPYVGVIQLKFTGGWLGPDYSDAWD